MSILLVVYRRHSARRNIGEFGKMLMNVYIYILCPDGIFPKDINVICHYARQLDAYSVQFCMLRNSYVLYCKISISAREGRSWVLAIYHKGITIQH